MKNCKLEKVSDLWFQTIGEVYYTVLKLNLTFFSLEIEVHDVGKNVGQVKFGIIWDLY